MSKRKPKSSNQEPVLYSTYLRAWEQSSSQNAERYEEMTQKYADGVARGEFGWMITIYPVPGIVISYSRSHPYNCEMASLEGIQEHMKALEKANAQQMGYGVIVVKQK